MYALKIKHINMQITLIGQAFKIDHYLTKYNNTIKLLVII